MEIFSIIYLRLSIHFPSRHVKPFEQAGYKINKNKIKYFIIYYQYTCNICKGAQTAKIREFPRFFMSILNCYIISKISNFKLKWDSNKIYHIYLKTLSHDSVCVRLWKKIMMTYAEQNLQSHFILYISHQFVHISILFIFFR